MLVRIIVLSVLLGVEALIVAPSYSELCPSLQTFVVSGDAENSVLTINLLKLFSITSVNIIVYLLISNFICNKFQNYQFHAIEFNKKLEYIFRSVITVSYAYSITRPSAVPDKAAIQCTSTEYLWAWGGLFLFLVFVEHVVFPLLRFVHGVLVPRRPAFTGWFVAQTGARLGALLGIVILVGVVWAPRYIGVCSGVDFDPAASAGVDGRIGDLIGNYLISMVAGLGAYAFLIRNILSRSSALARDAVFGGVSADVLLKTALGVAFVVGLGPFHEEATAAATFCSARNCALFTLKLFVNLAFIEHLVIPALAFIVRQLAIRPPSASQP